MAEVINHHPEQERFIRDLPDTECNCQHPAHPQSRKSINIIVKASEDEPARIDTDMSNCIRRHFKEPADQLSSVKGIGTMTTAVLMAEVPVTLNVKSVLLSVWLRLTATQVP